MKTYRCNEFSKKTSEMAYGHVGDRKPLGKTSFIEIALNMDDQAGRGKQKFLDAVLIK
jgi:hypothetical protein